MFCPNCGAKLEEGSVFCTNCGMKFDGNQETQAVDNSTPAAQGSSMEAQSAVQQMPAGTRGGNENSELPKGKMKGIIGAIVAVIAVILVIKLLAGLGGSLDYVVEAYDSDKKETFFFLNGKSIGSVDGYATVYSNAKKDAFYILNAEGEAFFIKGKKLVDVMDDCEEITVARDSKTAMLIDEDGALYRYNGSKLKEIVDEDVEEVVVSGDGKYYAYESDGNTYIGNKPGKETKVKDVSIVAISKNGKYMYGFESDDDDDDDEDYDYDFGYDYDSEGGKLVCVDRKGNVEDIQKEVSVSDIVGLNEDGTEILFTHDGKTYVSVKGKEPEKVSGDASYYVFCEKDKTAEGMGYFYPTASFKKTLAYGEGTLSKITGKYETEEIMDDITGFVGISDDLSRMYYVEDGDLYFAKVKKDTKGEKVAKDVLGAWSSEDCKCVYYIDEDDDLYYLKGTGKPQKVDGLDEVPDIAYFVDGALYFYDEDDWYYVKGKKMEKLKVDDIAIDYNTKAVYGYDEDNLYSIKGKNLKKVKGDYKEIGDVYIQ